jgi:hypothetical protein
MRETKWVPTPRYAEIMPDELIDQLFEKFKRDDHRWMEFAKREFFTERPEPPPHRATIVEEFVGEELGCDHPYEVGGLIIKIRKAMHGAKS